MPILIPANQTQHTSDYTESSVCNKKKKKKRTISSLFNISQQLIVETLKVTTGQPLYTHFVTFSFLSVVM